MKVHRDHYDKNEEFIAYCKGNRKHTFCVYVFMQVYQNTIVLVQDTFFAGSCDPRSSVFCLCAVNYSSIHV